MRDRLRGCGGVGASAALDLPVSGCRLQQGRAGPSDMNRAERVQGMTAEMLLALAREHVESNVAQVFCAGLPEPAARR